MKIGMSFARRAGEPGADAGGVPLEEGRGRGHEILEAASRRIRRVACYDSAGFFAMDPATVLPTSPTRVENVVDRYCDPYWYQEYRDHDVLPFRDLARAPRPVETLYRVTGGNPARSRRYREYLRPRGHGGDQLRAAFRIGGQVWGVVDLLREPGREPFDEREIAAVARLGPVIAAELAGLATMQPHPDAPAVDGEPAPGTALYTGDGTLLAVDEQATRWFTELAGPRWSGPGQLRSMLCALSGMARSVALGRERGPVASRLRAGTGRWFVVHASCLSPAADLSGAEVREAGLVSVVVEPAKPSQIAAIVLGAYGLTPREQEVTEALARGLANAEIGRALHLSPHTVRDHLKVVFRKVGVSSRGELVATLFTEHYDPLRARPGGVVVAEW